MEFALILPLLLLFVLGIIEAGRMLAIYSSLSSAAKQAARYGAVVGNSEHVDAVTLQPLIYYEDCDGIRQAALRSSLLVGLEVDDVGIGYDRGTALEPIGRCALGDIRPTLLPTETIKDGYRIVVTVTAVYRPLVPIVPLPDMPITFAAARTIFTTIVGPTNTPRPDPDLRLTKVGLPLVVSPNGTLTYWITATNPVTGVVLAHDVVITDTLPVSVTINAATLSTIQSTYNWACTFTQSTPPQSIRCTRTAPLAPGQSSGFSFPVQVPLFGGVTLTNRAGVQSSKADLNNADNFAQVSNQVLPGADLQINKSAALPIVGSGTQLTYTITLQNNGGGIAEVKKSPPSAQSYIVVTDTLPAGTLFQSVSAPSPWSCTQGSGIVRCEYRDDLGVSVTTAPVTIVVLAPTVAGTITNTATVAPSTQTLDPISTNNTAAVPAQVTTDADLELFMAGPSGPFEIGYAFTYRLNVTNRGPSIANGIAVTHTLPAGLAYQSFTGWAGCTGTSVIVCSYSGTVWPGQTSTDLVLTVRGASEGQHTYTAVAAASQPDPDNPADRQGQATTTITNCQPGQVDQASSTISGGSPGQLQADGTSEATITVELRHRCGGLVITSQDVTLTSSRGGADTLTPVTVNTTSGQATFRVKSAVPGQSTYTATAGGVAIPGSATVNYYGCVSLTAAPLLSSQSALQYLVNNISGLPRRLIGLTITWPSQGQRQFVGVNLQGAAVWSGSTGNSPFTLSSGWLPDTDGVRTVPNNPGTPLPVLQLNFSGFTVPLNPPRTFDLATTWDDGSGGSVCTQSISITR